MNKNLLKMAGKLILTIIVCAVVNSVLKHLGIEWIDAYAFAIGFLFAKIYEQKQTIIKLKERA